MKEIIKTIKAENIAELYKNNGVSSNRADSVNQKFQTMPDKFEVFGLCFPEIVINGETRVTPAFAINESGTNYIPVGQLFANYTDKTEASKINKEGDNKGKFLVVNNKKVNKLADGLSEAEFIELVVGKKFKSAQPKDFAVFQPLYKDGKPVYGETSEQALEMIKPKSYRVVSIVE